MNNRPHLTPWLLHGAWIGAMLGVVGSLWLSVPGAVHPGPDPSGAPADSIALMFVIGAAFGGAIGLGLGAFVALLAWVAAWILTPATCRVTTRMAVAMLVTLVVPIVIALALTLSSDRLPVPLYLPPVVFGAVVGMLVVRMFMKREFVFDHLLPAELR